MAAQKLLPLCMIRCKLLFSPLRAAAVRPRHAEGGRADKKSAKWADDRCENLYHKLFVPCSKKNAICEPKILQLVHVVFFIMLDRDLGRSRAGAAPGESRAHKQFAGGDIRSRNR